MQTLYEQDFYAWTKEQAKHIKNKHFNQLDTINIYEELLSMGATEHRELDSRLKILLMHLLKWQYQSNKRIEGFSWKYSIIEQRKSIKKLFKHMPSLKYQLEEDIIDAYEIALIKAIGETGLDENIFPADCPWTVEQILDDEFYPNQ